MHNIKSKTTLLLIFPFRGIDTETGNPQVGTYDVQM